jgi:hypothetical protein
MRHKYGTGLDLIRQVPPARKLLSQKQTFVTLRVLCSVIRDVVTYGAANFPKRGLRSENPHSHNLNVGVASPH